MPLRMYLLKKIISQDNLTSFSINTRTFVKANNNVKNMKIVLNKVLYLANIARNVKRDFNDKI